MNKLKTEKIIVPIEKVVKNPFNPNVMPKAIYEKMKQTISEKGLFGSIICLKHGEKYMILDGEHRTKACQELGYISIPVECSVDEMTIQEIQFWTIYFNNTRGKDDIEKRSKILEALDSGQSQLLPWTQEEIQNEKDLFKFDFSQYETKESDSPEDITVKILSFKFIEDEWKVVQEAIDFAKRDNQTPKQLFMIIIGKYLDLKRFRELQPVIISVDNLG